MELPSEQRRKRDLAEAEAAAGHVEWRDTFPEEVSRKLNSAITKWAAQRGLLEQRVLENVLLHSALGVADYDLGTVLSTYAHDEHPLHDARLDLLAALGPAFQSLAASHHGRDFLHGGNRQTYRFQAEEFFQYANDVLLAYRVDWEYVNAQLLPRGNQELHASVVRPTLELLSGNPALHAVEVAYGKALVELGKGESGNAITSAGVALQEMLETTGAKGNTVSKLASDAVRQGLLVGYDQKLTEAIQDIADWAQADRSTKGHTHKTVDALREDAWLMIHVAGALILRLSKGTVR